MSILRAVAAPAPVFVPKALPLWSAPEAKAILRLAAPIMLIALINMGMTITDTLMVSMLFGPAALAAVAVGSDLYSILFYLGAGVLGGLAPLYTAAVVKTNPLERARLHRAGQAVALLLGVLLAPLVWSAPDWLRLLGLDTALLEEGRGYTRAMALTLLPMLGVMFYRTILTAAEKPKVFLKVTLAMLPLNAAANWVFMLGMGPIPALGPTGAGIATFVVALASLLALACIARRDAGLPPAGRNGPWLDWRSFTAVLRLGIPIGIATLAEVGLSLGATIYAATLAAADVAAHTLTLRMAGVVYAVPVALLQASMVRMARAQALGDPGLQRVVTGSSLMVSMVLGGALCVALVVGAPPLAHLFFGASAAGLAAAGIAVGLLVLLGIAELAVVPGAAASGLLRGRKDTRATMLCTLVGHWAIGAPTGIYLCEAQGLGIQGIWLGLGTGMLATTVLTLLRLRLVGRVGLEPTTKGL